MAERRGALRTARPSGDVGQLGEAKALGPPVDRSFYDDDPVAVAPLLLNKVLVRLGPEGPVAGRIVEVEAYRGSQDRASHAYRGPSPRNAVMFGPPGHLYVYFTYGMHWCANAVCLPPGRAGAVLLRALAPVVGLDVMRRRRPAARRDHELLSGPARLCQALSVTGADDGADLVSAAGGVVVVDDGTPPPARPGRSTRVGIRVATEARWRWWVPGDPNVSRGRPSGPDPARPSRPGATR